jgi:hypothetical protein
MRARLTAVVFLFASAGLFMSNRPAFPDPPKERYVFIENTDRWVGVSRGDWYLVGKLDKNGDFVHEHKLKNGQPSTLLPVHWIINSSGDARKSRKVYEFRSGVLIPGEITPDGYFVPEVGGKIIPFKDYQYSPTATPIWNLPGVFLTEEQAAKLKKQKPPDK